MSARGSASRRSAYGASRWDDRPATAVEMESMEAALASAMEEGAFGLSSGLIYSPGRFASTDEIAELSLAS